MKIVVTGLSGFSLLATTTFMLCYLPMVSGGEIILLGDKHKKAGIMCEECHVGVRSNGDVTDARRH